MRAAVADTDTLQYRRHRPVYMAPPSATTGNVQQLMPRCQVPEDSGDVPDAITSIIVSNSYDGIRARERSEAVEKEAGDYASSVSSPASPVLDDVSHTRDDDEKQDETSGSDDENISPPSPSVAIGQRLPSTKERIGNQANLNWKGAVGIFANKLGRTVDKLVDGLARRRAARTGNGQYTHVVKPIVTGKRRIRKQKKRGVLGEILNDFGPGGDRKILRAIGRTAAVNAAVLVTTLTGGAGAGAAVKRA